MSIYDEIPTPQSLNGSKESLAMLDEFMSRIDPVKGDSLEVMVGKSLVSVGFLVKLARNDLDRGRSERANEKLGEVDKLLATLSLMMPAE